MVELKKRGVQQFTAPITYPSSVGLAEKYVHLTLTVIRMLLAGPGGSVEYGGKITTPLDRWGDCLTAATFAINNRIVKTHGFTPA